MTKLPPNYLDETVARWTTANDEHVLKEPESVPLTLLDSKEFRILDHDVAVSNARRAQAQAICMLLGQLGRAIGRMIKSINANCRETRTNYQLDQLTQSLPKHLLIDIGLEATSRLRTHSNRFESPGEFQTWLARNQIFWR